MTKRFQEGDIVRHKTTNVECMVEEIANSQSTTVTRVDWPYACPVRIMKEALYENI